MVTPRWFASPSGTAETLVSSSGPILLTYWTPSVRAAARQSPVRCSRATRAAACAAASATCRAWNTRANWMTARMTSRRIGVSRARSSVLAPRSVRLPIGSLRLDVVRGGPDLAVDHDADAERDHRQQAGDDRPFDRRGAAGALVVLAEPFDSRLDEGPDIADDRVVRRLEGL